MAVACRPLFLERHFIPWCRCFLVTGTQDLENDHLGLAQIQLLSNIRTLVSRNKGKKYAHQFVTDNG